MPIRANDVRFAHAAHEQLVVDARFNPAGESACGAQQASNLAFARHVILYSGKIHCKGIQTSAALKSPVFPVKGIQGLFASMTESTTARFMASIRLFLT